MDTGVSSSSFLFILFLLVPIGVIIFLVMRKKRINENVVPSKQKKDEVWRSIKYWLKEHNEQGKEIIDSYVAKRKVVDFKEWKKENKALWDSMPSDARKAKREEIKKHPRELYVVLFTTRDGKTKVEDKPRAIECEVIYARTKTTHDKETRNVVINGEMDYSKEASWIDPLRKRDETKLIKEEKRQAKREVKKANKKQKEINKLREERQQNKQNFKK